MASILHITDKDMIEFHRINGNQSFNFWRPSASKKFLDFKKGDFLFFLAKGTERNGEKGIIGYGICNRINICNFSQMWNRYGQLNGYTTKEECKEAILKVTKEEKIAKKLTCIELDKVVFFQAPVYLSEFGTIISNKLESYTYLDKEDYFLSTKVLSKANELGVDIWNQAMNQDIPSIERDMIYLLLSKLNQEIKADVNQNIYKKMKIYNNSNQNRQFLIGSRSDSIEVFEDHLIINLPILNTTNSLTSALGRIEIYKQCLKCLLKNIKVDVHYRMLLIDDNNIEEDAIFNLYKEYICMV